MKELYLSSGTYLNVKKGNLSDVEINIRDIHNKYSVNLTMKETEQLIKNLEETLIKLGNHLKRETVLKENLTEAIANIDHVNKIPKKHCARGCKKGCKTCS